MEKLTNTFSQSKPLKDVVDKVNEVVDTKYEKPDDGIPASDLASDVIPSELPASDVKDWAKADTKPSYTASEITSKEGISLKLTVQGDLTQINTLIHTPVVNDDAARAIWGGTWRIPTAEEFQYLLDNTTFSGRKNYSTSDGLTLILPQGGGRRDSSTFNGGTAAYYWTSSVCEDDSNKSYFLTQKTYSDEKPYLTEGLRFIGYRIRPVSDVEPTDGREYVKVGDLYWAKCNLGASKETDYGDFFAWGETSAKQAYSESNYKYYDSEISAYTKYTEDDELTTLEILKHNYVKDVQVNGESIVDLDGIASIPESGSDVSVDSLYSEDDENTTLLATITVDGEDTDIYAPTVDVTANNTSGTKIATISVGSELPVELYAPDPPAVSIEQLESSGTGLATINIGSESKTIYAPTVSVEQIVSGGTEIAKITVGGTTTSIYTPINVIASNEESPTVLVTNVATVYELGTITKLTIKIDRDYDGYPAKYNTETTIFFTCTLGITVSIDKPYKLIGYLDTSTAGDYVITIFRGRISCTEIDTVTA